MSSIAELVSWGAGELSNSDSARIDAEIVLAYVIQQNRTYLYTWSDRDVSESSETRFKTLLERRAQGEPIAYLVERQAFWSFDLKVTPATLIPRPETELLVELALDHIPQNENLKVVDLGTGSGAIALAIAAERPNAQVVATDYSSQALAVARENAAELGLNQLKFYQGSWLAPFDFGAESERFDLILSNPPYVEPDSLYLKLGDVMFEPDSALIGANDDGLGDIREIVSQAPAHLNRSGWLLLEHGFEQGAVVRELLNSSGFGDVCTLKDLAGHDRVTMGSIHS